jgi:phosphatidate cytidylyltransferase
VLRTRLKTAAILLPSVLVIVIFAPPAVFSVFIWVTMAWGLYESGTMVHAAAGQWAAIGLIGLSLPLALRCTTLWVPGVAVLTVLGLISIVGWKGPETARAIPGWSVTYAIWIAALFPYLALLRNGNDGLAILVVLIILVVLTDSGAYLVGRTIGRLKLLPKVSPNKTVEGAIGGLMVCAAGGLALRPMLAPNLPIGRMLQLAVGVGLLAQVGDLANSAFKRVAGVKDSGWIFPGHGGLLDRTCSLVFPVVFAYYYLR